MEYWNISMVYDELIAQKNRITQMV